MRDSLNRICTDFIANRQVLKKQFRLESSYSYPICASIFCARGVQATAERLEECKSLLKQKTGVFSNFRGNLSLFVTSMLAAGTNPESRMEQAVENYGLLKEYFRGSQYLALAAFMLADLDGVFHIREIAERGKTLYSRMKQEHPFLTSSEDSVFAVFMAFSERSDDSLIADMEACYTRLKQDFSSSNAVQSASHVLCLAEGMPSEKASRMVKLYDSLISAGGKYGKTYELSTLAALSILDASVSDLVRDLLDADAFLSLQKGYGPMSFGRKMRMMHAAMLVSDDYCSRLYLNGTEKEQTVSQRSSAAAAGSAVITGTLAMLAAQQAAMCAVIAGSTAASSASSS